MSREYTCEVCGKVHDGEGHEPGFSWCTVHLKGRIDSLQRMVEKQAYAIDKLKLEIQRYHGKC